MYVHTFDMYYYTLVVMNIVLKFALSICITFIIHSAHALLYNEALKCITLGVFANITG